MSKKLTKDDLGALAREVLDSLEGKYRPLSEMAAQIANESAASRRDIFEAIKAKAQERRKSFEPAQVLQLLEPSISPGSGNKPDFHGKYWNSLFDCVAPLCGAQARQAHGDLFLALLRCCAVEGEKAKGANPPGLETLASIKGVVSGLDVALTEGLSRGELIRTRALWLPIIPELAVVPRFPLSQGAAAELLSMLEPDAPALPTAVRLSISSIRSAAKGDAPGDRSEGTTSPLSPGNRASDKARETASPALLPELSQFASAFEDLLLKLNSGFEERLANQSRAFQRIEGDHNEALREIQTHKEAIASLKRDRSALQEQVLESQTQLDALSARFAETSGELERYRHRLTAVATDAEARELEAASRTKREFVEKQHVVLVSIRDCLQELTADQNSARPARQAATNFNNFLRFLVHSKYKYITPDQIKRIQPQITDGDVT
jgi:hypothetical protein